MMSERTWTIFFFLYFNKETLKFPHIDLSICSFSWASGALDPERTASNDRVTSVKRYTFLLKKLFNKIFVAMVHINLDGLITSARSITLQDSIIFSFNSIPLFNYL